MSTVKSEGLVAGVPWPMIQLPEDVFVHSDERPWVQMGEFGGSYVKVLYADKAKNTTVFLYQLAPDSSFPMHEHLCTAIAYTLHGNWAYGDISLRKGSLAFETAGSSHAPETWETGFTVLTVFIGAPGQEVLLRSQDPETLEVGELGIDFFIDLMTAQGADGIGDKH
jgi:quercetin dioxygenase-like cupin family protein